MKVKSDLKNENTFDIWNTKQTYIFIVLIWLEITHYIYYNGKLHSFKSIHIVVCWMVATQMICPCFTTKNLWMWIYLEKWVFADVIKFKVSKWDDPGLSGWPLNLITSVLVTEDTEKKACDYRDRDWNDAATSQATWCLQKLEGTRGILLRAFWGGAVLLTPWFQTSDLQIVR